MLILSPVLSSWPLLFTPFASFISKLPPLLLIAVVIVLALVPGDIPYKKLPFTLTFLIVASPSASTPKDIKIP